jgi:predicted ArsR family transcriptional regulator
LALFSSFVNTSELETFRHRKIGVILMDVQSDEAPGTLPAAAIGAVAALDDRLRRAMFEFIRRARRPVTRDEAAAEVGISRKLAAFHLDKLVEAGLLATGTAPGPRRVGRAPKAYVPAPTQFRISIPERHHEVLAEILLDAVLTEQADETAQQAAMRVAAEKGAACGRAERAAVGGTRLGAERALTLSEPVLAGYGYEPDRVSPVCVRLRSCPFHPVTDRSPELVCGLNHAFLSGFVDGLDAPALEAVLSPEPGECCVEMRSSR